MKVPDPDNPGKVLELTEQEYHQLCLEQYTKAKKQADGRNESVDHEHQTS